MSKINEIPFFRIIIPFLLGIILYSTFEYDHNFSVLSIGLFSFLLVFWIALNKFKVTKLKIYFGIFSQIFLVVLGYQLSYLNNAKNSPTHYSNVSPSPDRFIARVNSIPIQKGNHMKTELSVLYVCTDKKIAATHGKMLGYFQLPNKVSVKFGDVFFIHSRPAEIEPSKNPGGFDYKAYLKSRNIFHSVYLSGNSYRKIFNQEIHGFIDYAMQWKIKLLGILKSHFQNQEEQAIASSLLLGFDDEIGNELSNAYAVTGTIHVLSVSGLHIGIIYVMLNFLFQFLDKYKAGKILRFIVVLVGIWIFAMVSGLSPSVVRASLMCSLFLFSQIISRQSQSINTLLASAFLILCHNPCLLKDIGFQLSYLALGGILIFQPFILKWMNFENKLMNKIWALTSVSLAAQLTTFPVTMYYFHNFSLIFIFSNLLIIPLSTIVMYGGILLLLVSPFVKLSFFVSGVLSFVIRLMNLSAFKMSEIPGAQVSSLFISTTEVFIVFLMVIFVSLYFFERKKSHLFIALTCVVLFLLSLNLKYFEQSKQKGFVVYHDKNNTAVDVLSAFSATTLGISPRDADLFRCSRHVNQHISLQLQDNVVYSLNGFRLISITRDDLKFNDKIDLVILRNNPKILLTLVNKNFPGAKIVIDGTNKFSKNLRWTLSADSLNLDCWSTRKRGALVYMQ